MLNEGEVGRNETRETEESQKKQRQTVRQRQTDRPALTPSGGGWAAGSPELGTFPKALKLSCVSYYALGLLQGRQR